MSDKKLFLVIAIFALAIVILKTFIMTKEAFEDVPTSTSVSTGTPTSDGLCPQKLWWETEPPKQIVAYDTGVRFPVVAMEEAKALNSHFHIPYITSGDTEPSGCISVVSEQGSYTAKMCNSSEIEQRWRIVKVTNKDEYEILLKSGKETYSGISSFNIDETTRYGFFMVVSVKDPAKALAHNGNNLSVQTVGPFKNQMWDITKESPQASISTYDSVPYSMFDPHFIAPQSNNSFNPIVGGNPSNPYVQAGKRAMAQGNKPLSVNINLTSDALKSVFGIDKENGEMTDESNSTTLEQKKSEAFNPNCPNCPTILTDYIKNNEIPCRGCNLDNILPS